MRRDAQKTDRENLYSAIVERIFHSEFKKGMSEVRFERRDIEKFAKKLNVRLPKNLGDLIYSFRFRTSLPVPIRETAGKGQTWLIQLAGRSRYRFVLAQDISLSPSENLATTKVPDSTPGVIAKYALSDEQALLAKVRYNRLVDIFTGVTCYSLQSHVRTTARGIGQVETDEIYVGVDKRGVQYAFPIQAKGGKDRLSIVQVEQDLAVCEEKFSSLVCRPIGAQFTKDDEIALFEFEKDQSGLRVCAEKHYKLVPPEEVTEADLQAYRNRTAE